MKAKSTAILYIALLLVFVFPFSAFAELFGSDDEKWEKVFVALKKINSRLVTLETKELSTVKDQLESLLRELEGVKHAVPQLQGAIELNKSETLSGLNKTNSKLADLEAEVKNQVLDKIQQQNKILEQFRERQDGLKEGLAQDIEKFEKSTKLNFQDFSTANQETLGKVVQQLEVQSATTKKGFDDTISLFQKDVIPTIAKENQKIEKMVRSHLTHASKETQQSLQTFSDKSQELNQKLIEVLQESLKQGLDTKSILDAIQKDLQITYSSLENANQTIDGNHSAISEVQKAMVVTNKNFLVAEEKMNKLAESLKTLQAQNTESHKVLGVLTADLEQTQNFNNLVDEKFNKLIDLTSKLATHSTELENSVVGQLKESAQKENASSTKVDLANEKLSRLIEILKSIVQEQAKPDPVATAVNKVQSEQTALQKTQAELKKNQQEIKAALDDLRRKANVNISRNDDIKKTLGQLTPAKSKAGQK